MRKCEKEIIQAFAAREKKTTGNTRTDGKSIWLHGNLIVKREPDGSVWATLAGWNTPTTRSRVNAICSALGSDVAFAQRKGEAKLVVWRSTVAVTVDPEEWVLIKQERSV